MGPPLPRWSGRGWLTPMEARTPGSGASEGSTVLKEGRYGGRAHIAARKSSGSTTRPGALATTAGASTSCSSTVASSRTSGSTGTRS
eukprot:9898486-Alexandrium_andersonii.AAC.1